MNVPLITWCCIAIAMILLVVLRICITARHNSVKQHNLQALPTRNRRLKLFSVGSEREELFIPGDRMNNDIDYYGDDDN